MELPPTDAEGALPAHVARGTWHHGADRREDHVCVRANGRTVGRNRDRGLW